MRVGGPFSAERTIGQPLTAQIARWRFSLPILYAGALLVEIEYGSAFSLSICVAIRQLRLGKKLFQRLNDLARFEGIYRWSLFLASLSAAEKPTTELL